MTRKIRQVTHGAYFVESYSVQTIVPFYGGITTQAVIEELGNQSDPKLELDLFDDQEPVNEIPQLPFKPPAQKPEC